MVNITIPFMVQLIFIPKYLWTFPYDAVSRSPSDPKTSFNASMILSSSTWCKYDNDSDGEQDQVDHSSEGDGDGDDDGDDDGDGDTKQYLYTRFTEVEDTLLWKQQSKKRISNYDLEEHVFKQTRTHLQIKNRWCREGFKKYVAKNYSVNAYSNLLIRWKELEKY